MNDVKDYRKDELKYYVIGNILLFRIVLQCLINEVSIKTHIF